MPSLQPQEEIKLTPYFFSRKVATVPPLLLPVMAKATSFLSLEETNKTTLLFQNEEGDNTTLPLPLRKRLMPLFLSRSRREPS